MGKAADFAEKVVTNEKNPCNYFNASCYLNFYFMFS